MSFLDRILACNNFEVEGYLPWLIDNQIYGYIRPNFAQYLYAWPNIFQFSEQGVALNSTLTTYQQRTEAVAPVFWHLRQQGILDSWVNEAYPITHQFGTGAVMEIERAATGFMGTKTFGVHLNGLVKKSDSIYVWVGTRSLDKPFWPGKRDQMVAGGQPVGLGLLENVIKEAAEEATVPKELAQYAQAQGSITYRQQGWRGVDNSTIYVYDLWLPEDFVPENTDGEVIDFELMPLAQMADLTENTEEFKDNCNLVNIDLLLRLGFINQNHPDYAAICSALYKRDC